MAKLTQVFPGRYQTPDGVWSAVRIDDPELKRQAHRLPTDTLWALNSASYDVSELHPSLPACRARIAAIERQRRSGEVPSPPVITTPPTELAPLATKEAPAPVFPPILAGADTPAVRNRVDEFFSSVASMFETWVWRSPSPHTRRAYREDVMAFVKFQAIAWPEQAARLLTVPVSDVVAFRDQLGARKAPKTINRRISSLSSFYKYLASAAAELRLPITVPNPAQAQFLSRAPTDPRDETRALSAKLARQLMELPAGESVLAYRDRAILKFFLYSGARISTACRLKVSDFRQDGDQATIRLHEKGDKRRTIGLHAEAGQAIAEYIRKAELTRGPLFRPRLNPRSQKLGSGAMDPATLYRVVEGYLQQLPGATRKTAAAAGARSNVYTPHSLRATTATLLLDAGVDILKVQELLGHRHVTTTQVYDKRRRATSESASHKVRI
jgi:integrase/recombinase XerD